MPIPQARLPAPVRATGPLRAAGPPRADEDATRLAAQDLEGHSETEVRAQDLRPPLEPPAEQQTAIQAAIRAMDLRLVRPGPSVAYVRPPPSRPWTFIVLTIILAVALVTVGLAVALSRPRIVAVETAPLVDR